MFFNNDILFRNGSLALVWMAGNGELKNKSRRNKHYQSVLKANVITICKDLRSLFPNMGSAYGLSLKKMGILVKGVGIIYATKVEQFARDVFQASINMKRPVMHGKIDMPTKKSAKTKPANAKQAGLVKNVTVQDDFGDLGELGGGMEIHEISNVFGTPRKLPGRSFEFEEGAHPMRIHLTPPRSPGLDDVSEAEDRQGRRSGRKRPRNEDNEEEVYIDVRRRLESHLTENANAHCLREDSFLHQSNDVYEYPDLNFGDGMALLQDNLADEMGPPPPPDNMDEDHHYLPPTENNDDQSVVGPPSGLEFENQSRALETPSGAGTRMENTRRRRNEEREPDTTVMELDDINDTTAPPRRGGLAKRRLRLKVDSETKFTLEQMVHAMNVIKADNTITKLDEKLVKNRAPPKSAWKHLCPNALNFIKTSGRVVGSRALDELIEEIVSCQSRMPEKGAFGRSDPSIEEQRDRGDQTSNLNGVSVSSLLQNGQNLAAAEKQLELEPIIDAPIEDAAGSPHLYVPGDFPEQPDLMHEDFIPAADVGTDIEHPPEEIQNEPPSKKSRRSTVEEEIGLARKLDGLNTFAELYPPGNVSRRRAAAVFLALLKMQAKKEVLLHQGEPYGPIRIEKLN